MQVVHESVHGIKRADRDVGYGPPAGAKRTIAYDRDLPVRAAEQNPASARGTGWFQLDLPDCLPTACRPSVHIRVIRPVNRLPRRDRRSRIALWIWMVRPR